MSDERFKCIFAFTVTERFLKLSLIHIYCLIYMVSGPHGRVAENRVPKTGKITKSLKVFFACNFSLTDNPECERVCLCMPYDALSICMGAHWRRSVVDCDLDFSPDLCLSQEWIPIWTPSKPSGKMGQLFYFEDS